MQQNDFPFDQDFLDGYDSSTFFDLVVHIKIKSHYFLSWNNDYSLDNFTMWIDQRGSVFAMFDVDSSLTSYSLELNFWYEKKYKINNLGHAVAIRIKKSILYNNHNEKNNSFLRFKFRK